MQALVVTISILTLVSLLLAEWLSERRMTALITSVAIVILGFVLMIEWVWVGFVGFWTLRLSLRCLPRFTALVPFVIGTTVIAMHMSGLKFFGSPTLRDNSPLLSDPLTLDHLEPPNFLVATDGKKYSLRNEEFIQEITQIPRDQIIELIDRAGSSLKFKSAETDLYPSGFVAEQRIHYWCGNSWFPRFFPGTLPSHRRADLREVLHNVIKRAQSSP